MDVVAVIQARIGSSRLPGKVMYPLDGQPALVREIERTAAANGLCLDRVVVATTQANRDDVVARVARKAGASVFRGPETDVMERVADAVSSQDAEAAVRVCGDNPLIAPVLLEELCERLQGDVGYVTSRFEHTFPVGHNADAFTRETIQRASEDAEEPAYREHLGKYFAERRNQYRWENVDASDVFGQEFLNAIPAFHRLRITMDYPEDYELLSRLYREVEYKGVLDTRAAINHILETDLREVNAQYEEGMWPTEDDRR